jgi:5-oxoprolinase (ATP-hydrolysing) subunit A
MKVIDINCDMGESFGQYALGKDRELMPLISSANIACGFHAGDPSVMDSTVKLAIKHDVAIGAHPGYPDLQGFGRRVMHISAEEVELMVLYQIGALGGIVKAAGGELHHVKPHGALYNQAAKDHVLANAIARAIFRYSKSLILIGLAGSLMVDAGREVGLHVVAEGFPERGYTSDGNLIERGKPGAIIEDPVEASHQALRLATNGIKIKKNKGGSFQLIETLCIHGDSPHAVSIATAVRNKLLDEEFVIKRI